MSGRIRRRTFLTRCASGTTGLVALAAFEPIAAPGEAERERLALFDGSSLDAWRSLPRLPPPPPGAEIPAGEDRVEWLRRNDPKYRPSWERASRAEARWTIEDGVLVGEHARPDIDLGGYLVTKEAFGDFELSFEANPDWGADTGVMLRASGFGNVGFQLLVDNRDGGSFGGFHGNGLDNFRATAWGVKVEPGEDGKPARLVPTEGTPPPNTPLAYSCKVDDFIAAFKLRDWNRFKVRCEGKYPFFTTWVNDLKVSEFDSRMIRLPGLDKERIHELVGHRGHIALECHPNGPDNRYWAPGLKCRWRDITLDRLG